MLVALISAMVLIAPFSGVVLIALALRSTPTPKAFAD